MKPKYWIAAVLALVFLAFTLYGIYLKPQSRPIAQANKPLVLVSVPPQRQFLKQLAGEWIDVEVLVPPAANPETYEPNLAQMQRLARAQLYIALGHPNFLFEAVWLPKLRAQYPALRIVGFDRPAYDDAGDPHPWLSLFWMRQHLTLMAQELLLLLPEHADEINLRAQKLLDQINVLDQSLAQKFAPYRGRAFLVAHPAWSALAAQYGLQQLAIEQGHKEPDARMLGVLIAQARHAQIHTVFVQPQFDQKHARVLAQALGAQVQVADPMAQDWFANLSNFADNLVASWKQ